MSIAKSKFYKPVWAMGIELENQVIGILASALVLSFVGLLLADSQVEKQT